MFDWTKPNVTARVLIWPVFFSVVIVAWMALWAMGQEMRGYSVYGAEFWKALCGAGDVAYFPLVGMWAIMAAAMMVPTFAPALNTFIKLPKPAGRPQEVAALTLGYLFVWLVAAFGFAGFQLVLSQQDLLTPYGSSLSRPLTVALFLVAGAYQFSRLKSACLSRCRMPLTLFLSHWRPGFAPAFKIGLRIGADCFGCCWALMGLALIGGMTNLLWMGLATLLMILEKLPELGGPLTRPLGWALLAGAVITAFGGII